MSPDRPDRLTERIAEFWNDRPRADRLPDRRLEPLPPDHSLDQNSESPVDDFSSDRPSADHPFADRSSDHPADRFADRFPNRFSDRLSAERNSDRPSARFSDFEPVTPISSPSAPVDSAPGSSSSPNSPAGFSPRSTSGPTPAPTRIRSWSPQPSEPTPRAVGSPLPTGSAPPSALSSSTPPDSSRSGSTAQPRKNLALGRGLAPAESASATDLPSGVQRVVNAVRASLPFIQRILPLLDGNIGTAVSNLMAPPAHRPAPPPPPVDLAPLEEGISSLQAQQHELRAQFADQNTSLKRVEDQLDMVREATDRNTLEQQELLEDLRGIGNKVNIFAMVALLLLVVSVMVNVILYLHIKRVLP